MVFNVLIWGRRLNHVNEAESIMSYFFFLVGYCFDTKTFNFYLYTRFILSIARTTILRLAQHSRDQAIGILHAGESVRGVARRFGCSRVAIYDLQRRLARKRANSGYAKKWSSSSNNAESGSPDPSDSHPCPVSQCRSNSGGDSWQSEHRYQCKNSDTTLARAWITRTSTVRWNGHNRSKKGTFDEIGPLITDEMFGGIRTGAV